MIQVVTTEKGIVKIWDVSKRDARVHSHPISLREKISDFGQVSKNLITVYQKARPFHR